MHAVCSELKGDGAAEAAAGAGDDGKAGVDERAPLGRMRLVKSRRRPDS
ncbi:MAG: hypothetical protein O3A19_08205 [Planctomycetota bacterium]|nr:hypothetical protein [Planctomycetota bacterium]MDA1026393.1 hypothetical protein [Planctomycetota bacterium]